jgi:hypothetical protein
MEEKTPVANALGDVPWIDGDPARPNPGYFEHVDHVVDYANRQGPVLAMLPTRGYCVKEARTLNTANARVYGALARRALSGCAQRPAPVSWRPPLARASVRTTIGPGFHHGDRIMTVLTGRKRLPR